MLLAPVFVGAFCATFFALAPLPTVVALMACWAGLEVCGVCGAPCDAVIVLAILVFAVLLFVLVLHLDDDGRRCTH